MNKKAIFIFNEMDAFNSKKNAGRVECIYQT